jgi:WD40 repeat protein
MSCGDFFRSSSEKVIGRRAPGEEMSTPQKVASRLVHLSPVREVHLSPDRQFLLSVGEYDGLVMVSSASTLDELSDFPFSTLTDARVRSIASVPSTSSVIFADESRALVRSDWPDCAAHERLPSPEFDLACLAVNFSGTLLAVTGVDDPQIVFFNLDDPTASPLMNYENLAKVTWLGFGPRCNILVSINEANILYALKPPDYILLQEIELQVPKSGITWTSDTN